MQALLSKTKSALFIIAFYFLFTIVKAITFFNQLIRLKKWKINPKKNVLFLEVFPVQGAGYNYRVKKWMEKFNSNGVQTDAKVLIADSDTFFSMISGSRLKTFILKTGFKRLFQLFTIRNYETIIVRRSIVLYNDYGNLFMEKLLFSIHPNIILDFDDDIATNRNAQTNGRSQFEKLMLDNANHFNESLKYYSRFIVGSDYLKNLVKERFPAVEDKNICVIPTCVDYAQYPSIHYPNALSSVKFGWIGGNHNLNLVSTLIPHLNKLSKQHSIELIVISGVESYDFDAEFPVTFLKYDLNTEIELLKTIDVGLMPLVDDAMNRGKCGFKLIQYMGLGIPSIASAITVNKEIIDDNVNGWLVYDEANWHEKLKEVITKTADFNTFGERAKLKIDSNYSFDANLEEYLSFLSIEVK